MSVLSAETRGEVERHRDRYPSPRSAVLPSLWALQHQVGYLVPEGMEEISRILGVTPSDVEAVATFYSMYFDRPGGRHHVLVCVNVSCALRGADGIVAHLERSLGCPSGGTTADGEFTWEQTVECLGACGGAPAMQVDHHFHEWLTPDRVETILDRVRGTPPDHGSLEVRRPPEGPHPPTAETPPLSSAEGVPSAVPGAGGRRVRSADPAQVPVEEATSSGPSPGSRSRGRRRPAPSGGEGPASE
jgi:NADH-quinone oxidoreductase subunit E